jgi:hypothetical protein
LFTSISKDKVNFYTEEIIASNVTVTVNAFGQETINWASDTIKNSFYLAYGIDPFYYRNNDYNNDIRKLFINSFTEGEIITDLAYRRSFTSTCDPLSLS